eukprot:scaffold4957_cov76-Skeletonema_marinoi.AAC.1
MTKSTSKPVACDGCQKQFPSKNKLFQHLALNSDGCLSPDEYAEYMRNPRNFEKICVLYGYLPGTDYQRKCIPDGACGIEGGQHASWLLTQAIDEYAVESTSTPMKRLTYHGQLKKLLLSKSTAPLGHNHET